jgi:hypothetical protein
MHDQIIKYRFFIMDKKLFVCSRFVYIEISMRLSSHLGNYHQWEDVDAMHIVLQN